MIGVTSEDNTTLGLETGQVKLIKDTSIGTHEWATSHTTDIKWENNSMYSYLQGSEVLGNTDVIKSRWSSKIDSIKWNIGDIAIASPTSGSAIYNLEIKNNSSKIGLMYASDFYYANSSGGKINCNSTTCLSWIAGDTVDNWTMTRYGSYISGYYAAFRIENGLIAYSNLSHLINVYPVFYLNKDEVFVSGMGTENDPIIIRENAGETASYFSTRKDIVDYENNKTGASSVGILSLTDYYLAYNDDKDWYSNYDEITNWIG